MDIQPLSESYWEEPDNLEEIVGWSLSQGTTLLSLGAGVSRFAGLPNWEHLLKAVSQDAKLDREQRFSILSIEDPYERAQQIKDEGFGGDREAFLSSLREALYCNTDVKSGADTFADPGMQALSFLCSRSLRGGCSRVVTYNFDDLLSRLFNHIGSVSREVTSPYHVTSRADVSIFHPHGVIRNDGECLVGNGIVICTDDRSDAVQTEWNHVLRALFSTHFPLLIGLSGFDDALLQNLRAAKGRHPFIQEKKWKYFGVSVGIGAMNVAALEEAGIKVLSFSKPEEWPQFVGKVCRSAAAGYDRYTD